MSSHLVNGVEPGTVVRLAAPRGDFALPDPPPAKLLFVTAGSGITPVIAMLRSLRQRGESPDIMHVHSAHAAGDVIFHDELCALQRTQPDYRLHLQLTADMGKVDFAALDGLVPDWKDRSTWACGPPAMLDTVEKLWTEAGMRDKLHTERFAIARTDKGGEGGTVTFKISDRSIKLDGATTLMDGGEKLGIQMPFGCRMGICQSCVLPLESGSARSRSPGSRDPQSGRYPMSLWPHVTMTLALITHPLTSPHSTLGAARVPPRWVYRSGAFMYPDPRLTVDTPAADDWPRCRR